MIPVIRDVLDSSKKFAAVVKERAKNFLVLNLISSPGAGKTSLLERTLVDLHDEYRMAVIEGDLQSDNDARRIAATGCRTVQINTDGGCHLDSTLVLDAMNALNLEGLDILFIENVGNLVCPAEFDIGEDAKVGVLSVAEGDDKPEKYPLLFQKAKALVLNKLDLLPYVDFDVERAIHFARQYNSALPIFQISCTKSLGLADWYDWLRRSARSKQEKK